MDRPLPDPTKLLESWMEWERGDTPPGRVMSTLKTSGMRDLLEELVAAQRRLAAEELFDAAEDPAAGTGAALPSTDVPDSDVPVTDVPDTDAAEAWSPVV